MARVKFRVWIGVERENAFPAQPSEEYTDIDPGFGAEGEFDTEADALEFAERVHQFSAYISDSDRPALAGMLAVIMRLFDVKSYEVSDALDNMRAETREQHTPTEGRRRR